ncbi:hypothetical protein IE53DRAFT_294399, partial [Violaceomyces palustris]
PEQQAQIANLSKFTPSCSRCRLKKLKCDTKLPCNQCIAKGLQADCRKDTRVPRGRKRPRLDPSNPDDEIEYLKRKIKQLEKLAALTNTSGSFSRSHTSHGRSSTTAPTSDLDGGEAHRFTDSTGRNGSDGRGSVTQVAESFEDERLYSDEEPAGDAENAVAMLERLAASDPNVGEPGHSRGEKKSNDNTKSRIARDKPHPLWSQSICLQERIEILTLAKKIIPEAMVTNELVHTFGLRVHHLVGHVIHMPTLKRDINYFMRSSLIEIMTSSLNMYDLARFLMVLRLGMRFYPWKGGIFIDADKAEFKAVNNLKNRGDDISKQWRNLAKQCLAIDQTFVITSLTGLQAGLLMILDGRDSPDFLRIVLKISVQTALDMGLHRLGKAEPLPDEAPEDFIRLETGVRIWWYLVVKDWCSAQREGAYTIHPAQMTTRKPLHALDEDISEAKFEEQPHENWTPLSYVLAQIRLASIVREGIDLRNEQSAFGGSFDYLTKTNRRRLQARIESLLNEEVPPFYRLGSDMMNPGIAAVQRCLLHQQSFDIVLKLSKSDMASQTGRSACILLAEQIVSTQRLVRSVCPIIDAFWVNYLHLFSATLVLAVSLLLDEGLDPASRAYRKDQVEQALEAMRETPGSDRGSRIIEILLEEEEYLHSTSDGGLNRDAWRSSSPEEGQARLMRLAAKLVENTQDLDPLDGPPESSFQNHDQAIIPAVSTGWGGGESEGFDVLSLAHLAGKTADIWQQHEYRDQQNLGGSSTRPYEYSLHPWNEPPHP